MEPTDKLIQSGAVVGLGQGIQIALVHFLRNLGAAIQISNALAHPLPCQRPFGMALHATIDSEIFGIVHGHFCPQNAALWGISLVVEFDRVAVVAVLDPDSFLTLAAITDDLGCDPAMDLACLG